MPFLRYVKTTTEKISSVIAIDGKIILNKLSVNVEIVHSFFGANVLGDITTLLFVQVFKTEDCSKETLNSISSIFSRCRENCDSYN